MVTREFIDYISTKPLQVEVFGHYQHHPHNLPTKHLPRYDNQTNTSRLLSKGTLRSYNGDANQNDVAEK